MESLMKDYENLCVDLLTQYHDNYGILEIMSDKDSEKIQLAVLEHKMITLEILEKLINSKFMVVRYKIANHELVSPEILKALSFDRKTIVVCYAINSRKMTRELLLDIYINYLNRHDIIHMIKSTDMYNANINWFNRHVNYAIMIKNELSI